jgi:dihydrofolate synthase/folylpolyglutamate synthase
MGDGPQTRWLASLSPWPEEFRLGRVRALLRALGDPQTAFPAVHVVGTNGKSTTTRATAALLRRAGLLVGAFTSPAVSGWAEHIEVDGGDVGFEAAVGRVREAAERERATQFETLTAAALAAFADAGVHVAVVEAGLGGPGDATNVLDSRVVVLTNVSRDHTAELGETRAEIARAELAVVRPGASVVLGEAEWEPLARELGAGEVVVAPADGPGLRPSRVLATAAAAAFLGRDPGPEPLRDDELRLSGRYEVRSEGPIHEIRDGAHNQAGAAHLVRTLGRDDAVLVASLGTDKEAGAVLRELAALGRTFVATTSSSTRALGADDLAAEAREYFEHVETVDEPPAALARGRALAAPEGMLVVTGSLYLLADLHSVP